MAWPGTMSVGFVVEGLGLRACLKVAIVAHLS